MKGLIKLTDQNDAQKLNSNSTQDAIDRVLEELRKELKAEGKSDKEIEYILDRFS